MTYTIIRAGIGGLIRQMMKMYEIEKFSN